MPSITAWRVRAARSADREFILRLVPRLTDGFSLPPWRTSEEVVRAEGATLAAALDGDSAETGVLVAESDAGDPAGFIYLEQQVDYFRQIPHGHVSILAVDAKAQGQGAGRVLLEAAEDWARERGLPWLTLNVFGGNERARKLYERLGYAAETLRYVKPL
jgi:GNAT superfamily N-acetyltransferase